MGMYSPSIPISLFLFHLIGSTFFLYVKRLRTNNFIKYFIRGVILSMIVVCMLPRIFLESKNCMAPVATMLISFLLLSLFERFWMNSDPEYEERPEFKKSLLQRMNVIFILAFLIHTISDGMSFIDVPRTHLLQFSLGYGIQKFLESLVLSVFVYFTDVKKSLVFMTIYIYSLSSPLGVLGSIYLKSYTNINLLNLRCCLTGVSFSILFFNFIIEQLANNNHEELAQKKYTSSNLLSYGLGFFSMTAAGYSFRALSEFN